MYDTMTVQPGWYHVLSFSVAPPGARKRTRNKTIIAAVRLLYHIRVHSAREIKQISVFRRYHETKAAKHFKMHG